MSEAEVSNKLCGMCGLPMHRFGFPRDGYLHDPSLTATP